MSQPRRIVAAAGPDGKSCVVSNEPIPLSGNPQPMAVTNLWNGAAGRVDNAAAFAGGFAPFGMHQLTDPIYSVMIAEYAPGLGAQDPGMHFTDTADHFYVIAGEVVLVLEAGDVVLRKGDIGICRGAVHGWRNDGTSVARLLTFVLPAEPLAGRVCVMPARRTRNKNFSRKGAKAQRCREAPQAILKILTAGRYGRGRVSGGFASNETSLRLCAFARTQSFSCFAGALK